MKSLSLLRGGLPVCVALGMVWACSSDAPEKKVQTHFDAGPGEAGEGGSVGTGGSSGGLGSSGNSGSAGTAGSGGSKVAGEGGAASGGTTGAAGDTGTAGEAGASTGPGPVFHGLYVGTTGLDTNGGTEDAPFLTIAHAVSLAKAGDTIVLLDGDFGKQAGSTVPDGVDVMAQHSGLAKTGCTGVTLFTFAGSSHLTGIEFDFCSQPIVAVKSGTLDMVDLYLFGGDNEAGEIHVGGTVKATLTAAPDHVVAKSGDNTVYVSDTASLAVTGGTFTTLIAPGATPNATFRTANSATLTMKGVTFVDVQQPAIFAGDSSSVSIDSTTMDDLSRNVVIVSGGANFSSSNGSRLALKALSPSRLECLSLIGTSGVISIADTEITGGSGGIRSTLPTSLTITNSKIDANDGLAMDLGTYGASAQVVTMNVTNTQITGNGFLNTQIQGAMRITGQILNLKFRGVTITNNGGTSASSYGSYITAAAGSTLDFGTLADPGLNTFTTNGISGIALTLSGTGLTAASVSAVGNTWIPGVQGADPTTGKYAAVGAGNSLIVTGPTANPTGMRNYALTTTTLFKLAQNP